MIQTKTYLCDVSINEHIICPHRGKSPRTMFEATMWLLRRILQIKTKSNHMKSSFFFFCHENQLKNLRKLNPPKLCSAPLKAAILSITCYIN